MVPCERRCDFEGRGAPCGIVAAGASVGCTGGESGTGGGGVEAEVVTASSESGAGGVEAEVVTASSGAARRRARKLRRSFSGLAFGRGGSAIRVGPGGARMPVSSLGGGSGAGSVEEVVEDDGKLTMSVNGGGDLEEC